jgi:SNF2 family DNA or RNA helicase
MHCQLVTSQALLFASCFVDCSRSVADFPALCRTLLTPQVVSKLHSLLKPFMLRRLKADVEICLPRKQEVLLYAPMSSEQQTINSQLLEKTLGVSRRQGSKLPTCSVHPAVAVTDVFKQIAVRSPRMHAACSYLWCCSIASCSITIILAHQFVVASSLRDGLQDEMAKLAEQEGTSSSSGNAKAKLNNVLMQMRKNCNHPDLITSAFTADLDYPPPEVSGLCAVQLLMRHAWQLLVCLITAQGCSSSFLPLVVR